MLLAIDVGNTNIVLGYFKGQKLIKELRFPTGTFQNLRPQQLKHVEKVVVSSVVPKVDLLLKKSVTLPVTFVTAKNIPELNIKIPRKIEVGADRLVNAYAAYKLYKTPIIIVDFGTATTFCVVTQNATYVGGIIAPGIHLSREVLHNRTAKLPLIDIKAPQYVIGDSTKSAMQSGLVIGYACMVEGLLKRIKSEMQSKYKQQKPKVILTGGFAPLINSFLKKPLQVDTKLTLKGLELIARGLE